MWRRSRSTAASCTGSGARVFTGTDLLSRPSGTAVVIADGRIEAVVAASELDAGCVAIDLGDATILPGLIDPHVHLAWDGSADPIERSGREPYALTVLRAANHAAAHLRAGVTVVRDICSAGGPAIEVARAIDEGIVVGPRVLTADGPVAERDVWAGCRVGLESGPGSRPDRAPIVIGTDAGAAGRRHGSLADEVVAAVRAGARPGQALRVATVDAAALLGIGSEHGALEPGRRADLLVVGGDLFCDIAALRDVRLVVSGGCVVVDSGLPRSARSDTDAVRSIREFLRDHRAIIRALSGRAEHPDFSRDQQRILLEVGAQAGTDMTELLAALDMDPGQLSRVVHDLQAGGAVDIRQSPVDRRRRTVVVTEAGRRAYEQLEFAYDNAIGELIHRLPTAEQTRVASAMDALQQLFRLAQARRTPTRIAISEQSPSADWPDSSRTGPLLR